MTLPRSERGPTTAAEGADGRAPGEAAEAGGDDAGPVSRGVELDAAPAEVEPAEEAERPAWIWRREGGGPSRVEPVLDPVARRTRLTVIETAPLRARGPLLTAAAARTARPGAASPLAAARWAESPARLRDAVRLVLA